MHDDDVREKLHGASSIVMDYLKLEIAPDEWKDDLTGQVTVPDDVKGATLLILGELFWVREGGSSDPLAENVAAILRPLRDPTLK
jgi:hypothetical protein